MGNAARLWAAFLVVADVLQGADLKSFAYALFFATPFVRLDSGARRVAAALAVKTGAPAAAVYNAIAAQSWGVRPLKQLSAAVTNRAAFPELDTANRTRMQAAADAIPWPTPLKTAAPKHPDKPAYHPPGVTNKSGPAVQFAAAAIVLLLIF